MKSIVQTFTTNTLPSDPIHGQLVFLSDTDNILIADKTGSTLVWRQYNSEAQYTSNAVTAPSYPLYLRGVNEGAFSNINNYDQYKNDTSIYILFDKWNINEEKTPRTNNSASSPRNYYRNKYTYNVERSRYEIGSNWNGYSQSSTDIKLLPKTEAEAEAKGLTAYFPPYNHRGYTNQTYGDHEGLIFPVIKDPSGGYSEYAVWERMVYLGERDTDDIEAVLGNGTVWQTWKWKNYNEAGGINNWALGKYPCWYVKRMEESPFIPNSNLSRIYELKHYFLIADPEGGYHLKGYTQGMHTLSSNNGFGDEKILDIELGTNFWGVTAGNGIDADGYKDFVFLTPEPKFSTSFTRPDAEGESALFFDDVLPFSGDGYQLIDGKHYRETEFHISPSMLITDSTEGNTALKPVVPTSLRSGTAYDESFKPSFPTGLDPYVRPEDNTNPGSGGDLMNNINIVPYYNLDPNDVQILKYAHRLDIEDAIEYVSKLLNTKSQPWEIKAQIYLYGSQKLKQLSQDYNAPHVYEESDGPDGVLGGGVAMGWGSSQTNDLYHTGFDGKKYLRTKEILIVLDPADLQDAVDENGDTYHANFSKTQGKQFIDTNKYATLLYSTMVHELLHCLGFTDNMFLADRHLGQRENRSDIYPNQDLVVKRTYGWDYIGKNGVYEWNQLTGISSTANNSGMPMGSEKILLEFVDNETIDSPSHYVMDYQALNDSGAIAGYRAETIDGIEHLWRYDANNRNRIWLINRHEVMNRVKYYTPNVPPSRRNDLFVSPLTAGILNDVGWIVDRDLIHTQYNDSKHWVNYPSGALVF